MQAILFAFGMVNAGVPLLQSGTGTWGVLLGLLAGNPIGILVAVAVAVVAGLQLPDRFRWRDLAVVGASGIGFTVALFFASAAFPRGPLLNETKIGALHSIGGAGIAFLAAMVLRAGCFAPET